MSKKSIPLWQELIIIAILAGVLLGLSLVWFPVNASTPRTTYQEYAAKLEATYGLEPGWLRGTCDIESNWNPKARGAHGEIGLCQIKPDTLLKICPECRGRATLSYGSRGAAVARLQRLLDITSDGVWGPETQAAVITFQQLNNLRIDGVVGARTWLALGNPDYPVVDLVSELEDPFKNMTYAARYYVWLGQKLGTDDGNIIAIGYNGGDASRVAAYVLKSQRARMRYAGAA